MCTWQSQELVLGWDGASRLPMAPVVAGDSCLPVSGRAASARGLGADPMHRALRRRSHLLGAGAGGWDAELRCWSQGGDHVNGRALAWGLPSKEQRKD